MLGKVLIYTLMTFVTYKIAYFISNLDPLRTVYKHYPGPCTAVPQLKQGSEDMERIPGDKILITTGLRFLNRHNPIYEGRRGRIFLLDLRTSDVEPRELEIRNYPGNLSDADFHGLSSWVDPKSGEVYVFVVDHGLEYSCVRIFLYQEKDSSLNHLKTCKDQLFYLLNDVVAVTKNSFYVTNYMYSRGPMTSKLEMVLGLNWGSVVFYDGEKAHQVKDGLFMANGINRSPDGRFIYVAVTGQRQVHVYRQNADNSLTLVQNWPVDSLLDNIIIDDEGHIWLTCHAIGHKIMTYMDGLRLESPSQVLQLKVENGLIVDSREVFVDDGKLISGSSVALYAKNKLFVGSISDTMLVCEVRYI